MPKLWEGCFIGDKGDMIAALRGCPRLLGDLRRAGWDEARVSPIHAEHVETARQAMFFPDDYGRYFLESLGGIELFYEPNDAPLSRPRRLAFQLDNHLNTLQPSAHYYVMQLLGQVSPFPVGVVDDFVLFVEPTAQKSLLLEREFRACYRSANPFKLIEYIFYRTEDPAVTAVPLSAADVPPKFRNRFA